MSLVPSKSAIALLRGVIHELRTTSNQGNVKDKIVYKYVIDQFRNNVETDQKICRGEKELRHLASSYLCYLTSNRRYQELFTEYHGKGERSVAETARLVGLCVPKPPVDS